MADVQVEGLVKAYGAMRALDEVTMHFPDGKFFGLLGPSGSGKTTLLRAIAGFVIPDKGQVSIGLERVEDVPVEAREIGMVFQNYALFPNMTVAENVAFGLQVRKVSAPDTAKRVAEALELVQLGPLGARKPHQLSGGQRQRVAIARALALNPRIMLLDEPTSALDVSIQAEILNLLNRLRRELNLTFVIVSHDLAVVSYMCERLMVMRQARTVETLSREQLRARQVADPYTAELLRAS